MFIPVPRYGGVGCSRVQRQAQILFMLWDEAHTQTGERTTNTGVHAGWLTTGQLASKCDMSASPHFRSILVEMYDAGWLSVEQWDYRPNMVAYYWHINNEVRDSQAWKASFDAYLLGAEVLQWER